MKGSKHSLQHHPHDAALVNAHSFESMGVEARCCALPQHCILPTYEEATLLFAVAVSITIADSVAIVIAIAHHCHHRHQPLPLQSPLTIAAAISVTLPSAIAIAVAFAVNHCCFYHH
jgi:hypothetical protein